MEIMEEGNMTDRVRILLQRDLAYYNDHQTVLLEKMCTSVIGGQLDFPLITTFVAAKMVTWWEESYLSTFKSHSLLRTDSLANQELTEEDKVSVGKSISTKDFTSLVSQTSLMLIDHLHILSQEALDHADLSVLTGTIGATALIRNALWTFNQNFDKKETEISLTTSLKMFQNMAEALAERLLDLHCRLISLYVLQDVDSLDWKSEHPFFEGERSSFTIQMWWLYIQGTRDDLWSTMPPKTAERVLLGILNESLTILSSRYSQASVSIARTSLFVADLSNILLCVFKLLPAVSNDADELMGCKIISNAIRDIHVKCDIILCHLIMKGTPLTILYKIFKDGFGSSKCLLKRKLNSVEPWIIFAASESNELISSTVKKARELPGNLYVKYELHILLSHAEPIWHHLLKVLTINNGLIMYEILKHVILDENQDEIEIEECKGFLCNQECKITGSVQCSIVYILMATAHKQDMEMTLVKALEEAAPTWTIYFNHTQVWNQKRPIWISMIIKLISPMIQNVIKCYSKKEAESTSPDIQLDNYLNDIAFLVECIPEGVVILADLLEDILPADVTPAGGSVLIQFIMMTFYDELGSESAVAEAICRANETKFHTLQTDVRKLNENTLNEIGFEIREEFYELTTNHILMDKLGSASFKIIYNYLKNHAFWLLSKFELTADVKMEEMLLYKMFHIGNSEYDAVLSKQWIPKWTQFLGMPLGLTIEELQQLLSTRSEFSNIEKLKKQDQAIVHHLSSLLTTTTKRSNTSEEKVLDE